MSEEKKVIRDLPEIEQEIKDTVAAYNKAFKEGDAREMASLEASLRESEKDYAAKKRDMVFAELRKEENPVLAGIKQYEYPILRHRKTSEGGVQTGIEVSAGMKPVDLVKLCNFCDLPDTWKYKVEKLNLLLATRAAKELGYNPAQIKEFVASWYLSDIAKAEEMGATPMSNTQCVKMLQSVVDAILPDGGFKVNNYDVSFLLNAHLERDKKERHTMKVIKGQHLHNVILDVLNRVVTGSQYKVKPPKLSKDSAQPKAESRTAKPENDPAEEVRDVPVDEPAA